MTLCACTFTLHGMQIHHKPHDHHTPYCTEPHRTNHTLLKEQRGENSQRNRERGRERGSERGRERSAEKRTQRQRNDRKRVERTTGLLQELTEIKDPTGIKKHTISPVTQIAKLYQIGGGLLHVLDC